jgi:hypothetical protein
MKKQLLLAASSGALVLVASLVLFAPGVVCRLSPLGDEGEGECLAWIVARSTTARCRVSVALLREIAAANNDVVISSTLSGFVEASACDDLALIFTRMPSTVAPHAFQLVVAAIKTCRDRTPFSLGVARAMAPAIDVADVSEAATRSKCK